MNLTDNQTASFIEQTIGVPPFIATFPEVSCSALVKDKCHTISVLLRAEIPHTRIDTTTKDVIIRLLPIGCNIALCSIGDQGICLIVSTKVVVSLSQIVMIKTDTRQVDLGRLSFLLE